VPEAIKHAAGTVGTLEASNGKTYTRGADGEWTRDGWLGVSKAEGNIRNELNAVYKSQQTGLADMAVFAKYAKEHPLPEPSPKTPAPQVPAPPPASTSTPAVQQDPQRHSSTAPTVSGSQDAARQVVAVAQFRGGPENEREKQRSDQDARQPEPALAYDRSAQTRQTAAFVDASNSWNQTEIGQRLNQMFAAATRGDEKELGRLAQEHAQTPGYKALEAQGQEGLRQWELAQQQAEQQSQQQSRGISR
jgi:hypothetical protein